MTLLHYFDLPSVRIALWSLQRRSRGTGMSIRNKKAGGNRKAQQGEKKKKKKDMRTEEEEKKR